MGAASGIPSEARVMAAPPAAASTYVHSTPRGLVAGVRVGFCVAGLTLVGLAMTDWPSMPVWARALCVVLAPALAGLALWPRAWRSSTKFTAGPAGVCFPANDLLVLSLGGPNASEWLFVPWGDVAELRLSRSRGDDSSACLAFDVRVDPVHQARFFGRVARAADRPDDPPGLVHAAFDDNPPAPAHTLRRLIALRDGRSGYSL